MRFQYAPRGRLMKSNESRNNKTTHFCSRKNNYESYIFNSNKRNGNKIEKKVFISRDGGD